MRTCGSTAWKSLSAMNIASVIDQSLKLHSFTSDSVSESTCQARLRFICRAVARDARLKLARYPLSLVATLATLPSMSPIPQLHLQTHSNGVDEIIAY